MAKNQKLNCKICQKEFRVFISRLKAGRGKFCSRECYYLARKKEPYYSVNIRNLKEKAQKGTIPWNKGKKGLFQNSFKGKKLPWMIGKEPFSKRLEVRKKISETRLKMKEKLWNWKGGVVDESKKLRKSLEWKLWREAVFVRDNYICRLCGLQKRNLHPHHKYSFVSFPEKRFEVKNGLTLCENCHRLLHSLKVNDILYGNIFTHQIYVQNN